MTNPLSWLSNAMSGQTKESIARTAFFGTWVASTSFLALWLRHDFKTLQHTVSDNWMEAFYAYLGAFALSYLGGKAADVWHTKVTTGTTLPGTP